VSSFFVLKGDERMKHFKEQLIIWKEKHDMKSESKSDSLRKAKKKPQELSEKEIKELMGMGRPRYSRGRGGALRQK
jgi:hypothetical protein